MPIAIVYGEFIPGITIRKNVHSLFVLPEIESRPHPCKASALPQDLGTTSPYMFLFIHQKEPVVDPQCFTQAKQVLYH